MFRTPTAIAAQISTRSASAPVTNVRIAENSVVDPNRSARIFATYAMDVSAIIASSPVGRMNATPICESQAQPKPNMAIIGCVRTPPKTIVFRSIFAPSLSKPTRNPSERATAKRS